MPRIEYGVSRMVILIGRWALKFPVVPGMSIWNRSRYKWPNFLHGLLANMQEVAISKAGYSEVAPIVFHLPGGFLSVMARCRVLTDEEFEQFDVNSLVENDNYIIPAEKKSDSFGWLDGRVVAIDYGN